MMNINKVLSLSAMSGIALTVALSSGCKFTGGGSMQSASGITGEKATLAITGKCDEAGTLMSLDMQYNDHGSDPYGDVRFHANSEIDLYELFSIGCIDLGEGFPIGTFAGEYCPQPYGQFKNYDDNAGCGAVAVVVGDGGEGKYNQFEDGVGFTLIGGAFDGYTNVSTIQGNIQAH